MGVYQARMGRKPEQKELAAAAGLSEPTMTAIMNLGRAVRIPDAIAFADYLGVEFAWLAAGRGPMEPPHASSPRQGEIVEPIVVRRPEKGRQGRRA